MRIKSLSYYFLFLVYVPSFYVMYFVVRLLTLLGIPKRNGTSTSKRILFLECMGPPSAGYRHRSQGWVDELNAKGYKAKCWYVLDYNRQWRMQQTVNGMLQLHLVYLIKRFLQCYRSIKFETVIVRRELLLYNDYGNLFFEKWMRRIHPNILLDADDDISAAKHEPRTISTIGKLLMEHPQKFKASLQYYTHVIVASTYLKELFVSWDNKFNDSDITIIPTCVDYYKQYKKDYSQPLTAIKIGWVGSAYNLHSLYTVYPALDALSLDYDIELIVICNATPKSAIFPVTFIEWNEKKELENLMQIDVGIMPLMENETSKGKGGFKLIQYLGCGIVSVATALTINKEIVEDGVNGFLVNHQGDWQRILGDVLKKKDEFANIGEHAAQTIKQCYSYDAHISQYVQIVDANHN